MSAEETSQAAAASDAEERALAARFEAEADAQIVTHVLPPRDRIFLPQTVSNRFRGFWWSVVQHTLFRWSPVSFDRWRAFLLRLFGANIEGRVCIAPSVQVEFPWNLSLGPGTTLCEHVIVNCMGRISIGPRTRVSQYSHLISGTHEYNSRDMHIERFPITIGADVWIAADAFVGPGVTLHDGCLLAARSSAFRDLPAGQVCMGEPARPRHARFDAHSAQEAPCSAP